MLKLFVGAVTGLSVALAQDKPAPVKPKMMVVQADDEAALRVICDAARASQAINLETSGQMTSYCLGLISRVKQAQDAK